MSGRRYVKSREKARRLGVGAGFLFLGFTLLLSGELLVVGQVRLGQDGKWDDTTGLREGRY